MSCATKKHRLLILGSLQQFVVLTLRAKERGYYVVVADSNPDGPAKTFADSSYNVNIADTEAMVDICRKERIDGIVTSFSDFLAERYAMIAEAAGIPAYITPGRLKCLRDKSLMKAMFEELDISYPKSRLVREQSIESDLAGLSFPCVAKPVAGWGSHGITLLHSAEEVAVQFERIAGSAGIDSTEAILVEEYNDGLEFNLMTWIVNGEPCVLEVADREKTWYSPSELPQITRVVYPSRLTDLVVDEACEVLGRVAHYVGIENGPLCMQFFWSPGRPVQVCECAGRIFGYEHELFEYAMNGKISVEELLLDRVYEPDIIALKLQNHDPHLERIAFGLYFLGYEDRDPIASIQGVPTSEDPNLVDVFSYYQPGEVISHDVGSKPYVILPYFVANSYEEANVITDRYYSEVSVKDANGRELLYKHQRVDYGGFCNYSS